MIIAAHNPVARQQQLDAVVGHAEGFIDFPLVLRDHLGATRFGSVEQAIEGARRLTAGRVVSSAAVVDGADGSYVLRAVHYFEDALKSGPSRPYSLGMLYDGSIRFASSEVYAVVDGARVVVNRGTGVSSPIIEHLA